MSEPIQTPARPVSLITIVFVFVLFAAAALLAYRLYAPAPMAAYNAAPENLSKELEWRATAASRRGAFTELVQFQAQQMNTYGWIDQQAGVVRLPIQRAMELTVEKYGSKK